MLMERNRPYIDPNLSLPQLSHRSFAAMSHIHSTLLYQRHDGGLSRRRRTTDACRDLDASREP